MSTTPTFNNIFDAIAYLLYEMRHSIEQERGGRPPRWLRMARAKDAQGEADVIGKGVKIAVEGFINAVSWMSELVLDIEELLVQTDAAKALLETSTKFIETATGPDFKAGLEALTGASLDSNVVSAINNSMQSVNQVLDYIPEPEDVAGISHELYRLLALEQWPLPPRSNESILQVTDGSTGPDDHIRLGVSDRTGKLRLLQWAFGLEYTIHGLGPLENPESEKAEGIVRLGARRLASSMSPLAASSRAVWTRTEKDFEIFQFSYGSAPDDTKDIQEAHQVLDLLGYYYYPTTGDPVTPSNASDPMKKSVEELERRLERFQEVNDIAVTGQLDNETLNRLFNLDYGRKSLTRAKPFDASAITTVASAIQRSGYFTLINHDAELPHDGVKTDKTKYPYYTASQTVPLNSTPSPSPTGWLTDPLTSIKVPEKDSLSPDWSEVARRQGFVAMHSRELVTLADNRQVYDYHEQSHWKYSEGESASGNFFFCAVGKQPWIAARFAALDPSSDALFPPHDAPANGTFSQMYQWVNLQPLLDAQSNWGIASSTDIYLSASCLQRSLFRESTVDQGRLRIEAYASADLSATGLSRPHPQVGAYPDYAQTAWFPSSEAVDSALHLSHSARKRNWVYRKTADFKLPAGADRLLLILEGQHRAAQDTDAYFDNIMLRWEFRNTAP